MSRPILGEGETFAFCLPKGFYEFYLSCYWIIFAYLLFVKFWVRAFT